MFDDVGVRKYSPHTTTDLHTLILFSSFCMLKISRELNQSADSEMLLRGPVENAPERLCDLLRGEATAKSPTLIRKSSAGSWVQQQLLNLRADSVRLQQQPGLRTEPLHQCWQHRCFMKCLCTWFWENLFFFCVVTLCFVQSCLPFNKM